MAVQAVFSQQIALADFDASGRITSYEGAVDVAELDSTTVSSSGWRELTGGIKTWSMSADGFVDFAASNIDAKLDIDGTFASTITPVSLCPTSAGGTLGEIAYAGKASHTSYAILGGAVGDLAPFKMSARGSVNPLVRGKVLHASATAETATANGTGYQLGAVTAAQSIYLALHVFTISGAPTFSVILESDDNSGFTTATTRITSASYSASTGAEWRSLAGAVTDDYWRVRWTVTGGTNPSISFLAVVGIA